jgi:ribonucleoside-diphosphate reductase beta chain
MRTYVTGNSQSDQTIEAVVHTIDEGLERLPSYMDLYFKWERQQWAVQELDFSEDKRQWDEASEYQRQMRMGLYVGFYAGEIAVTDTLGPYIAAMPRLDQRVFLTTQVADEARHVVFFDKWFTEVLGKDRQIVGDHMARAQEEMGSYYNYIFYDLLPGISNDLRKHPEDIGLLVDGVTLYHIVIESAMALAGQTRSLQLYKQMNIFPGFQEGFTDVARDESRHVLFGVKFLYDMVQGDNKYAYRIVDFINTLLPGLYDFGRPSPEIMLNYLKNGEDIDWTPNFYASSLRRKLRAMGIHANIPDPTPTPIPPDIAAAARAN